MDSDQLRAGLATTALAFRGYNVRNLGRSHELLVHQQYGSIVRQHLSAASQLAADLLERPVDLISQVESQKETTLERYGEAVALLTAMELAQLEILRECFDVDYQQCQLAFGYSLGEITALVTAGVFSLRDALAVPLSLEKDCVSLAEDVTLGILFSRGETIEHERVNRALIAINQQAHGVIGVSAILSPNSLLLLGQADTLDRLYEALNEERPRQLVLRKNKDSWPPLHCPIVWQRQVPDHAAQAMLTLSSGNTAPTYPVLSLVTGQVDYTATNCRDHMRHWVDHPQLLWEAIYQTLKGGTETVVHIGPAPNIIPSTYQRLSSNIETHMKSNLGMRMLSAVAQRPWLNKVLPDRAALLRAPSIQHVVLEDWLLDMPADEDPAVEAG